MPSVVRVQRAAILQSSEVPSSRRPVGPRQGALRAPWQPGPWRAPKPAPKSISLPKSDLKCNPVTTKARLVNPTSATTIRPSSRLAPLKAEHPVTRCTSSRRPPTREIKLQTATSQASRGKAAASRSSKPEQKKVTRGERPVTKGTNPVVKALPRRLRARAEDILPPSVTAPPTTTPLLSSKIHSTSFFSSTPLRPKISSPLLSAEIPLEIQTDGTHIIEDYETRRALDKFDMESGTPPKSFLSCTPSRAGIGRIRRAPFRPCRDPCRQKAPLTSIRRESLSLPPRPVDRVETPVPSDLVVHAERSMPDSADVVIDILEEMQDPPPPMQADLVDGWAAKMEAMGLRSALS